VKHFFVLHQFKWHGQDVVLLDVHASKIRRHRRNHLPHHHLRYNIDRHGLIVKEVKKPLVGQDAVMHALVEVKHDQDVVLLVQQDLNHLHIRKLDNNYQSFDVQIIHRHQLVLN
jgi:hypothetical protein